MAPFHAGEREVQERAGEAGQAAQNGRMIADRIPLSARLFLARQPLLVVASVAPDGAPWASVLIGRPGFAVAAETALAIDLAAAHPDPKDPLWMHLERDPRVGLLAIDLPTRRRYRVNGRVERSGDRLVVAVVEAYPNCPQYIQRREPRFGAARGVEEAERGGGLSAEDLLALERCDTFFVASVAPGGMPDASHRGGHPGFIERLADGRLRIPDYPGNSMFNTWGNLALEPRVGLVVPDFAQGRTLQLGGRIELEWGKDDAEGKSLGTGRFWRVGVERVRVATTPMILSWESVGDGNAGTSG